LRSQQRVGLGNRHNPTRRHHRQRTGRRDDRRDAIRQLVTGRPLACVNAFDVEGAKVFFDEPTERRRQRRFFDFVFTLKEIDRIRARRCDLFENGSWRRRPHPQKASRIALTMALENSVLTRSSAVASWPKKALGSVGLAPLAASYSCRKMRLGFSQSTLLSRTSR